jgi:NADH:ubiquinone oxidoreductase subunit F (NADH-binding)/NADH:ubiquinone oxidoreductase subunit E
MRILRRLHELQARTGHLRDEDLRSLARELGVPLYRIEGLVSFYPHFRTEPPKQTRIALCRDMCCWLAGGEAVRDQLQTRCAGDPDVEISEVSCLGRCDSAPAALLNDMPVSASELAAVKNPADAPHRASHSVPRRRWRSDPYDNREQHYGVVRDLLAEKSDATADEVLAELKVSGLRGEGGAGFPTAAKWQLVREQPRTPKYVVANADESEPATFKDRVLLESCPHLMIEGMIVAGLVVGAERGIVFLRHEYEPERKILDAELQRARDLRVLGRNVVGSGFDFDIEVFVSPGGYILGEETALLEALEDRRGEPRNKPPFPATHGLNGQPTVINNVETLAKVPAIVRCGGEWWRAQGKPGFGGLKFLAVSGHIERPGVYEVPVGTTVRELIDLAGGMKDDRALKAFAPGGASSNFLPASAADVPLDFDALLKAGSMLGSGAVFVVAKGTDMAALAANVLRFFRNESCGKCVPCRVGSQKAVQLIDAVRAGELDAAVLDVLPELDETLRLTSICGLGQVALNPVMSARKHWPQEFGE